MSDRMIPMHEERESENTESLPGILTGLGELPTGAFVSIKGLAELYKCHTETIKRHIDAGHIPPPIDMPGGKFWTAGFLLSHFNQRLSAAHDEWMKESRRIAALPT